MDVQADVSACLKKCTMEKSAERWKGRRVYLRSVSVDAKRHVCCTDEFVHLVPSVVPTDLDCEEVKHENERPLGRNQKNGAC